MHGRRSQEPMMDAALDREIEQVLAVDPSPAFVSRVRAGIAREGRGRFGRPFIRWPVGMALACTALVIAAVLVAPAIPDAPGGDPVASHGVDRPLETGSPPGRLEVAASPSSALDGTTAAPAASTPKAAPSGGGRRPDRSSGDPPAQEPVLTSPDDTRAFAQLLEVLATPDLVLVMDEEQLSAAPDLPAIPTLVVNAIDIAPSPAAASGGEE